MASDEPLLNLDSPTEESSPVELSKLKKDLESYRELFLPVNKVLEWEQNYYPAIIVGVITFVFAVVWYIEPSVLTSVCLTAIICCAVDFAAPTLVGVLFSSAEWTASKDLQFDAICRRILNAKHHVRNLFNYLTTTRQEKPKVYLIAMMGAFACLAWFGSIIDNLFLTYLIVIGLSLCPGVRKSGILDKLSKQAAEKVAGLKDKAKSN